MRDIVEIYKISHKTSHLYHLYNYIGYLKDFSIIDWLDKKIKKEIKKIIIRLKFKLELKFKNHSNGNWFEFLNDCKITLNKRVESFDIGSRIIFSESLLPWFLLEFFPFFLFLTQFSVKDIYGHLCLLIFCTFKNHC